MKSKEKSKWDLKREKLEQKEIYLLMMRRIENAAMFEKLQFNYLYHRRHR